MISGAQRAEFIRLSQGREPFQPATLQFVSHFASWNSLGVCTRAAHGRRRTEPPVTRTLLVKCEQIIRLPVKAIYRQCHCEFNSYYR